MHIVSKLLSNNVIIYHINLHVFKTHISSLLVFLSCSFYCKESGWGSGIAMGAIHFHYMDKEHLGSKVLFCKSKTT